MKYPLNKKELRFKKKKLLYAFICIVLVVGVYWVLTREKQPAPDIPVVSVMPVEQQNVEIFGEYVDAYVPNSSWRYAPCGRVSGEHVI